MANKNFRFKTSKKNSWELVVGPVKLAQPASTSDICGPFPEYKASEVVAFAGGFPVLMVTRPHHINTERWQATISSPQGELFLRITLTDTDEFGGFLIWGDCEFTLVKAFWRHLRRKYRAIWLFAPDLFIYGPRHALPEEFQ